MVVLFVSFSLFVNFSYFILFVRFLLTLFLFIKLLSCLLLVDLYVGILMFVCLYIFTMHNYYEFNCFKYFCKIFLIYCEGSKFIIKEAMGSKVGILTKDYI